MKKNIKSDKKIDMAVDMLNVNTTLGKNIRKAREKAKLSQLMLAKLTGTTQRIISRIESGDYNLGMFLFVRISRLVNLELVKEGTRACLDKKKFNEFICSTFQACQKSLSSGSSLKKEKK